MSTQYAEIAEYHPQPQQRQTLMFLGLASLILLSMTVANIEPWNNITRALGILLALFYIMRSIVVEWRRIPEVLIYLAWVSWCIFSITMGYAVDWWFWQVWLRILQLSFLIIIIADFVRSRRDMSAILGTFVLAVVIISVYSLYTGNYAEGTDDTKRLEGFSINSNGLGWMATIATAVMAYFFVACKPNRITFRVFLLMAMAYFAYVVIKTGSRKAILGLGVFYIIWLFSIRRIIFQKPMAAIGIFLLFLIGSILFIHFTITSGAGTRFAETWRALTVGGSTEGSGEIRLVLYKEALILFLQSPLFGIGMDQFRFHSTGNLMEHSDYMAVLCGSGFIGFILYFSIFIILLRRLRKIIKYCSDTTEINIAKVVQALLLTSFFVALGRWNYDEKYMWIVFACFIGYSHFAWNQIQSHLSALHYSDPS